MVEKRPTLDSAEAWREISYIVGIGRRCIRRTNQYYTHRHVDISYYDVKSSTKPSLTRQKYRIYEPLARVTTGKVINNRTIDTYTFLKKIMNLKTHLGTDSDSNTSNTDRDEDIE